MFKLSQKTPEGRDCTAAYEVILDKEYTVREFIYIVLTEFPRDWGKIRVDDGSIFGPVICAYWHGDIEDISKLDKQYVDRRVISARAHGGWSLMDYYLTLKGEE